MITLTIVRHGESTDNLKALWAGSSDAPLSSHGMNQAIALGQHLSTYPIDAIFASNLLRATWTAQQVQKHQNPHPSTNQPSPPLTLSPLLQEQHFGKAERQPWTGTKGGNGWFRESGRGFKFEDGESLDDVRDRAMEAIATFIEPILLSSKSPSTPNPNIFIVAHGIFNAELLGAFLARRSPRLTQNEPIHWKGGGMTNTGWTRIEVGYEDEDEPREGTTTGEAPTSDEKAGEEVAIADPSTRTDPNPSSTDPNPPTERRTDQAPYLKVKILCTNVSTHLDGLKRQGGGIGSAAFDEKQKGIREFFAGGGGSAA